MLVPLADLQAGYRLAAPIQSADGTILIKAGETLTDELVGRIQALGTAGVISASAVSVLAAQTAAA